MADSDIHEKLYDASVAGEDTRVRELLAAGADPDKYKDNNWGHTALIKAALDGHDSTVSILIQHGADIELPSSQGSTALTLSAANGHNKVVQRLIEAGAELNIQNKEGKTALHKATVNGSNEVTTTLIKAGADLNIQDKEGKTALHKAAENGSNENGSNELTSTLIKAGADLNIQDKNWNTALTIASQKGYGKLSLTLIEGGADLSIKDKDGETVLNKRFKYGNTVLHHAAFTSSNTAVTRLFGAGADLNIQNNDGETALAVAASGEIASTLMEAGAEVPSSLASRMMNKDPSNISSILDFLSKKLDKSEDYQKTKEILGIEIMKGEQKVMFYNIECKRLDKKSLLEYIDSQNVRLVRQREELIDLSVKIANLKNRDDTKETAMEEVINHYKSGLPSGVGLRDMITMIKERYPWSSSKKKIMIFVSLVTCLLAIGLFLLDLTTDLKFSLDMFKNGNKSNEPTNETEDLKSFLSSLKKIKNVSSPESLHTACDAFMNDYENYTRNSTGVNSTIFNYKDYEVTGWIAIWHCIQPFVATMIVFFSINFSRGCREVKRSFRDVPEHPDCIDRIVDRTNWRTGNRWPTPFRKLNYLLCGIPGLVIKALWSVVLVVGKIVPLPVFTHLYRFYLDVRSHHARSKPDFRTNIVSIEEEIKEHEALGEL